MFKEIFEKANLDKMLGFHKHSKLDSMDLKIIKDGLFLGDFKVADYFKSNDGDRTEHYFRNDKYDYEDYDVKLDRLLTNTAKSFGSVLNKKVIPYLGKKKLKV
jgi:hypothetical protein